MVVLSYVRIPVGPVPIVLENFGVMLAALLLGTKRGTAAVILFIILRTLGLGGPGGIVLLFSPVSGYIYGWLLMPIFINLGLRIFHAHRWLGIFIITSLASVVLDDFICGGFGLVIFSHMSIVPTLIYNLSFVIGDLIKALVVAILYAQIIKSTHFRQLLV